jgi:hypothetical protein
VLCFVLAVLASLFKSKLRLEAENAVLRHQLIVLKRRLRGRVRLTNDDRWFFIQLLVSINPEGSHNHPARDAGALAQGRLSLLLALEVTPTGRATADRHGAARIDAADERRKSALGRATHPRRTVPLIRWASRCPCIFSSPRRCCNSSETTSKKDALELFCFLL